MVQRTLAQLEDRTCLLPGLIADRVSGGDESFTAWAVTRTLHLYNRNEQFRRLLHRQSGREWLYAFMRHWREGGHVVSNN